MYQFSKVKYEDGSWRFELNGISLIVDGFTVKKNLHYLKNPEKAIAFFNFKGHLYGVANQIRTFSTAEELYDTMRGQFAFFKHSATQMGKFIKGRGADNTLSAAS